MTYSPAWSNWNDSRDFHGSESFTSGAGNYVQHTFTGPGIRYVSMTQPNMGKVDVYIDGNLVQSDIDAYAATVTKQVVLFEKTNVSVGTHTIKVVCKGTKNAASSNTICALDSFASNLFPVQAAYYKLVNKNSGKVIDVSGGSSNDGANAIQWNDSGAINQHWQFVALSGGDYKIFCQKSGKVLAVNGASTADGASVVQYTDNGGANQHWQIIDAGNGYSKIKNTNSGKLLAVSGSSLTAGAQIVQTTDTNADSQLWQIVRVS